MAFPPQSFFGTPKARLVGPELIQSRLVGHPFRHISPKSGEKSLPNQRAFSSATMCRHRARIRPNSLMTIASFFNRKKKSSPCGPYFAGTFQCADAVRKRTLSHGSKSGQTLSHNGLFHISGTMPEPSRPQPLKTNSTTGLEPKVNFYRDSPRTSKIVSRAKILSLRCSFHSPRGVFFLPKKCCLCILGLKKSSHLSLAAFIFQRALAILTFIWLPNSRGLLISS